MEEIKRILVVDDEPQVLELVIGALEFAGFKVTGVKNATLALEEAKTGAYDAGVFDVMLPDFSGFTLLERMREKEIDLPVLFLTAKDSVPNRVRGLETGAEDYLVKPFSVEEMIARVRAILRRASLMELARSGKEDGEEEDSPLLSLRDLTMNQDTREVFREGHKIDLSPTEFDLLELLVLNKGRIVSKDDILYHVWQQNYAEDFSIIEVYISYLRKKIDCFEELPKLIETKRGVGYLVREV